MQLMSWEALNLNLGGSGFLWYITCASPVDSDTLCFGQQKRPVLLIQLRLK